MAKRNAYSNSFFDYVNKHGLCTTDEASFSEARRKYHSYLKRKSKQQIRKQHKVFEILLTEEEFSLVSKEAMRRKISTTRYIKIAALSSNGKVMTPAALGEVREQLFLFYNTVQTHLEEETIAKPIGVVLLRRVVELEAKIMQVFR